MSATLFAESLRRVLVHEGGRVDDPHDPGGRTAFGVTQATYDGYRRSRGEFTRDVWTIDESEKQAIYRLLYWNKVHGDELPAGVDYAVFDGAVNSGPAQAARWLQRALSVEVDGNIGPATLQAARDHPDHDRLIADMLGLRMGFLQQLNGWGRYGKGWSSRVAGVKAVAQSWAEGSVGPSAYRVAAVTEQTASQRANPNDISVPSTAEHVRNGAFAGTGVAEMARQYAAQLQEYAYLHRSIMVIVGVLGLIGVIAGIYVAYRKWRVSKTVKVETRAVVPEFEDLPVTTSPKAIM